jgi:hypothetical protein
MVRAIFLKSRLAVKEASCTAARVQISVSVRRWVPEMYRGTSLIRNPPPLELYRRPMPRVLGESWEGGRSFMSEVSLRVGSGSGLRHTTRPHGVHFGFRVQASWLALGHLLPPAGVPRS